MAMLEIQCSAESDCLAVPVATIYPVYNRIVPGLCIFYSTNAPVYAELQYVVRYTYIMPSVHAHLVAGFYLMPLEGTKISYSKCCIQYWARSYATAAAHKAIE